MFKFKLSAFTLVELLVVIAIVGLLSTIVLAVTSGVSEQGRIAKGLQFSQHLENGLGAYLVGKWTFDEGSGDLCGVNKVCDTSGWGNDGSMANSPVWRCATTDRNYTSSGIGCSLEFSGTNQYINCGNNSSLSLGNKITVESFIKWSDIVYGYVFNIIADHVVTSESKMNLAIAGTGNTIGADIGEIYLFNGSNVTLTNIILSPGAWTHLVIVREGVGSNQTYIYKDGILSWTGTWAMTASNPYFLIGAMRTVSNYNAFAGLIDNIHIYSTSLNASQIQSNYYANLKNLLIRGFIDEKEYQERLFVN